MIESFCPSLLSPRLMDLEDEVEEEEEEEEDDDEEEEEEEGDESDEDDDEGNLLKGEGDEDEDEDEEEEEEDEDGDEVEVLEEGSGVSRMYLEKLPRLSILLKGEVEQGAVIFWKACCPEARKSTATQASGTFFKNAEAMST
ncbi:hypothetical protein TcWFU_010063 [Taenia crassiceps]|uniref:Uncharacterized protein n=1 Tax=Taenia crassiceps TaxID=6207 RepID=A0ABR4QIA0_9CEST